MRFITKIYLQGELKKTLEGKTDFCWKQTHTIVEKLKSRYKNHKLLQSVQGEYYCGWSEEEKVAFCINVKQIEVTDFTDINGNHICVDDKLVSKADIEYKVNANPVGWFGCERNKRTFYIRTNTKHSWGLGFNDTPLTQELINTSKLAIVGNGKLVEN